MKQHVELCSRSMIDGDNKGQPAQAAQTIVVTAAADNLE